MKVSINNETLEFPSIRLALSYILSLFRDKKLVSEYSVLLGRSQYHFKIDSEYIYVYKNHKFLHRFALSK